MSRNSISEKPGAASSALDSHVRRYGHDLAWIMNRLDSMERLINEQQLMLSKAALWLSNLENRASRQPESKPESAKSVTRGNCRIIPFQKMV